MRDDIDRPSVNVLHSPSIQALRLHFKNSRSSSVSTAIFNSMVEHKKFLVETGYLSVMLASTAIWARFIEASKQDCQETWWPSLATHEKKPEGSALRDLP